MEWAVRRERAADAKEGELMQTEIDVPVWDRPGPWDRVYECELLREVMDAQIRLALRHGPYRSAVEVGVGTARFAGPLAEHVPTVVGVDIHSSMLDAARERCGPGIALVEGDAARLHEVLAGAAMPGPRLVACVTNTFGIFPEEIRGAALEQMIRVADGGDVMLGVFNADRLPLGLRDYYEPNRALTGPIAPGDVDYELGTLSTASGFESKWFRRGELTELARQAGLGHFTIEEAGRIGLVLVGRVSAA